MIKFLNKVIANTVKNNYFKQESERTDLVITEHWLYLRQFVS